jgi:hypothetical protein
MMDMLKSNYKNVPISVQVAGQIPSVPNGWVPDSGGPIAKYAS